MALPLASGAAQANLDAATDDLFSLSVDELAQITVTTASWTPQLAERTPASVSVVTADQIRAMGARTIYDVLKHLPGIRVDFNNRLRPIISIRGARRENGNHLLFLLDGHSMNETMTNSASFLGELTRLPVHNIKRIEVLRGPGSARFGSTALAGVVNIITRDAEDLQGTEVAVRHEFERSGGIGQEYNVLHAERFASGTGVALNLNVQERSGEELFVANAPGLPTRPNNHFDQFDFQGKLDFGSTRINGRFVSQDRGEYYGVLYWLSPDDTLGFDAGFLAAESDFEIWDWTVLTVRAYYDAVEGAVVNRISPDIPTLFEIGVSGRKYGIELRAADRRFTDHQITYGLLVERQSLANPKQLVTGFCLGSPAGIPPACYDNDDISRDVHALFVEDVWPINDDLTVNLGVRYDSYSDFGNSLNPRIGLNWRFLQDFTLRAVYATAFQAPDFRSLYSEAAIAKGNPDLTEERMRSAELGLGWHPGDRTSLGVTLFRNKLENLIVSTAGETQFHNGGAQTVIGTELEARYDLTQGGYVSANYTYMHTEMNDCCAVPDEPRHSASLVTKFRLLPKLYAGAGMYWQSRSPRDPQDRRPALDGYATLDLNLTYRALPGLELELNAYNLLDDDYFWPTPYNTRPDDFVTPGRTFMVGLRFTP